jgi:hypothetical protein
LTCGDPEAMAQACDTLWGRLHVAVSDYSNQFKAELTQLIELTDDLQKPMAVE